MADNAAQIEEWNGPLGERWANMKDYFDRMVSPFGLAALSAANAQAGERVLDVGCGCGETTLLLSDAAGAAGSVLGVDISRPMLETARALTAFGPGNVEFREADASTADLPRHDLLFSRFGVMFFDDPTAAFTHLRDALKPSGRLAFCCWRTPKENPWASVPMAATRAALPPGNPPSDPHAPGPFAFADPHRLRGILSEAGFGDIAIRPFEAPISLGANAAEAAQNSARFGPAGRLVREAGVEHLPVVLEAIETAVAPLADADGSVSLQGAVWIVTASNEAKA